MELEKCIPGIRVKDAALSTPDVPGTIQRVDLFQGQWTALVDFGGGAIGKRSLLVSNLYPVDEQGKRKG